MQPTKINHRTRIKHFSSEVQMRREWQALTDCSGSLTQRASEICFDTQIIKLEFIESAIPLNDFSSNQSSLVISLLPKIIRAINHCHKSGWVHGDVKPSNILYLPVDSSIKLIDFGASFPIGTERSKLTEWEATPMFASPSQLAGDQKVSPTDDWYALNKVIEQIPISQLTTLERVRLFFIQIKVSHMSSG